MARNIVLIAHNLRSCHNVGSLFRTAEGLGVQKLFLTGYTPYPVKAQDERLPHNAAKAHRQIRKTALGTELSLYWQHYSDIYTLLAQLKSEGFVVAGLEQDKRSVDLISWQVPQKVALLVGRETEGIESEILKACDVIVEIPMAGLKESFNVVQAAAMALYHCVFS